MRVGPPTGHELGQGGDERPVRPLEAGTGDLGAQNGELVAQHKELRVLGDGARAADSDQLDDLTDKSIEEAERHGAAAASSASSLVNRCDQVIAPFR